MIRRTLLLALLLSAPFVAVTPAALAPGAAGTPCASLAALTIPNVVVRAATAIAAGPFTPPGARNAITLPAFCRVEGVARPTSDSEIGFEVWIPPAEAWNGKFQGVGNGGYSGSVSYPALATALRGGYATASTDTGHIGDDLKFGDGHPEKVVDWAHRAIHLTADVGKLIVRNHTGRFPDHSYFVGCSTGGHQALSEAQRYPDDYDGIVAGNPGYDRVHQTFSFLWLWMQTHKDGVSLVPMEKLPMITKAAVAACDAVDGVKDGIIDDPRKCTYDPKALVCRAGDDPAGCLSLQEADAVRKIWNGPTTPAGKRLWFGLERGAPLGPLAGALAFPIASTHFQLWIHQDPMFDWRTLTDAQFETDFTASQDKFHDVIGTDDPDLQGFRRSGGKMIIWHGEADPLIFPRGTVNYFDRVIAQNGGRRQVDEFARLFLAPGVGHCGGGDGPNPTGVFDLVVNWVEKGVAPATVPATRRRQDGTVVSRPLCPYPAVARWNGRGSPDETVNFSCVDGQHRQEDFQVVAPARK